MKKKNYKKVAKNVIDLEIKALKKLKSSINNSFNEAVDAIVNCQSKVILCGVGKSGLIAAKISATLSSVGTPSFSLSANDCSHGDLGSISKKDILILISYSGSSEELRNIIKYANRNKIQLIGIVSKKNSILYKASDIKLLTPEVAEAGLGIVPTSSTINQLSIGDALAVASLNKKKISKKDFKNFHPSGSLGAQLKTVEDLMLTKDKIPFINEGSNMKDALKIITQKKLGTLIVKNNKGNTTGIITDGQIRRVSQKNNFLHSLQIKKVMTKNPIKVSKEILAIKALAIMNEKKITSLCVYGLPNKSKTIGIVHIHNLLDNNIG
ncbi:arabinose-5-phosphate isomerase [Candidatus Pelagibacter ubique]|uniref:Arabinose-5-phosphate isomerase n=1 Tax=Pelagibacter ubique TaxID=198252 RepID=A0ABX1T1Z8_PELUQ|nr:KpsF/GutQ family sugar-phosphate isomerase [Candidatus Pelagibacter ubique]NMN67489.1 arabinose-5-phosphate isomerase [Candidatus Pelagibacter ubique]